MSTSLFLFVLISATLHATWNFVARRTGGNLTISWWSLWISCLFLLPFVLNVAATQGILEFVDITPVVSEVDDMVVETSEAATE